MDLITVFFCASLAAATPVATALADGNRPMAVELFKAGGCVAYNARATEPRVENVIPGGARTMLLISVEVAGRRVYAWLPVESPVAQKLLGAPV